MFSEVCVMSDTWTCDLQKCCKGSTCDRQVVPGYGEAAVQTSGIQKEHSNRHGETEAPRRHAEHTMWTTVAGTMGYHGNHSTAHG